MLYYCKITKSVGIDNSEGKDVICNNCILNSKQCEICNFFFNKNRNFNYQSYVCGGECHIPTIHTESLGEIKIVITKKGTYRTVSSIPYNRIVKLLETNDLNEKAGFLVLVVNNSILVRAEGNCGPT